MSTQSYRHIPTLLAAFAALPLTGAPMAQMEAISASSLDRDLKTSRVDRTGMPQLPTITVLYTAKDHTDVAISFSPKSNMPGEADLSELYIKVTTAKRAVTCRLDSAANRQDTAYAFDESDSGNNVKIDASLLTSLEATVVQDIAPLRDGKNLRDVDHLSRAEANAITVAARNCDKAMPDTVPPTTSAPDNSRHGSNDGPNDINVRHALMRPPSVTLQPSRDRKFMEGLVLIYA